MVDRPFRFGVITSKCGSGKELTEQARTAEALGYASLFVPDHFIDHDLAPTVALAHVAAVTDTLRVGPLVLGNDYKHPVVLAREMATLDLLSDGRLELGIGAGWMTVDYEKAGLLLDRPGVRIARLAESIAILKGLFAPGPFSFTGEHYRITDLDGMPKPPQGADLPFLIGGGGKKILGLAAREAKIVGINANLRTGSGESPETAQSLLPEATDQKLAWLREAAGDEFANLEIQSLLGFAHVADDVSGIAKAMAGSFGVSEADAVLAPATLVGSIEGIIELLEQRRERWQMSYVVVPIEATEMLAPVVARLAGT
jgi:probable F420-dependent oxidoreductase